MYAIVPADNQVTITVCKCEFGEEYLPYDGEELIEANEPILVRGNISDTIPNLYVIAKKGSEKVCYTPVQSGMDGRLENSETKVYDFTPYDKMTEFSGSDEIPDAEFCGNWIAFANDGNGEERALVLGLNISYVYGIGNSFDKNLSQERCIYLQRKFHCELRKYVGWLILPRINTYKCTTELFFFEKLLYLRLLEHRKRTVTLYQNYGSFLVQRVMLNPNPRQNFLFPRK